MNRNIALKNFIEHKKKLNSAQLKAVEQIEGPVMALAGPGTGKTHVLCLRICEILLKTDTAPQNILCLTFTDAAVKAMEEKLTLIIGDMAQKVNIQTFHSFCLQKPLQKIWGKKARG